MKKFLIMLAITILAPFVVITDASATELEDKYIAVLNFYKTTEYYNTYPYCVAQINNNYLLCNSNSSPSGFYLDGSWFMTNNRYLKYAYYYSSATNTSSCNTSQTNTTSSGFMIDLDDYYFGFDFYTSNNTLAKSADFDITTIGQAPTITYTITFTPPRNTTIVVKDSNNNEIQASSQYVYELEAGTYTYSASNTLYTSLTNVSFTVSEDATINVEMTERLQTQPIRSIYSQFYNYISTLVQDVFDVENPLFLFIVSFIIGFAIITILKRLIGGIL